MSMKLSTRLQAALVSAALLVPASSTFAMDRRSDPGYHRHGALAGAAVGAVVDRHHRVRGAVIGATAGAIIQHHRNNKLRNRNVR
jgi:hypothetical protein